MTPAVPAADAVGAPAGVVFDCDGVPAHSQPLHARAAGIWISVCSNGFDDMAMTA